MDIKLRQSIKKAEMLEMQLKVLMIEKSIREAMEFKCLICMETMDVYLDTPCKHAVCKTCYYRSLDSVNGNKCCICRQTIVLREEIDTA